MSFVPLAGTARFRAAVEPAPPREGTVEFADERRTITLPIQTAIPVLTKAWAREELPPSVALVASAAHLGLRLVAAGRLAPGDGRWEPVLGSDDDERVRLLAAARAYDGVGADAAEEVVRGVVAAVVDAMPRATLREGGSPTGRVGGVGDVAGRAAPVRGRVETAAFQQRLAERIARHTATSLPALVRVSLRVESDEETLEAGELRLVPQVHDESDPLHLADASALWATDGAAADHGFSHRAKTHALVALRGAADAWPVLDRLLAQPVPDRLTLDAEEIGSLLEDGVAALRERGVDVLWPHSLRRELTAEPVVERRAAPHEDRMFDGLFSPGDLFAFQWRISLAGEPLSDDELDRLSSAASPVVKLRGQWTVVDPATARRARKRLIKRLSAGEALAVALTGEAPAVETAGEPTPAVVGASVGRLRDAVVAAAEVDVAVPAALRATLRGYQVEGFRWLAGVTGLGLGCCLADDMGLGKTLMLIALHLHRSAGPTLVVCPTSLLGNWEAEIGRFAPTVDVRRFHGGARDLEAVSGIVLTTYATMRRDHEALARVPWDLVVADEAQHVKNASSSTAKALRKIPSRARVALTGTPVENDLTELWSILDWCVPGLLGSRLAFRRAWASQIESRADARKARQFAELVGPFLLRRRKSDPGIAPELPPKTETDQLLGLTREQTVLYTAYVRDVMERIERLEPDDPERRGLVLALLTGLKQICNHPAQFLKEPSGRISGRSEKIDVLDELIGTALSEVGSVLVFTQYVAMARLLESHWAESGIPHQFLHGGTPVRQRERMVAAFQAGEVPVFLLSLHAGGVGLNLTRADHVIHVDRWWNPAAEDQATDRAHRIGQSRPVQVHRLVTRGTIEERIGKLLDHKRELADAVLGRGEAALTELSDGELRDLVELRADHEPGVDEPQARARR